VVVVLHAKVPYPDGTGRVRTEEELAVDLFELWRQGELGRSADEKWEGHNLDRFVIKLDDSASGGGNALFDMRNVLRHYGLLQEREALFAKGTRQFETWLNDKRELLLKGIADEFSHMAFQGRDESWPTYRAEIPTQGVHAERYIEHQYAPSCQAIISTDRQVTILSTHEQILDGHTYLGCKFPSNLVYRSRIQDYTRRIGQVLAQKGALGYFAVDFLASCTEKDITHARSIADTDAAKPDSWKLFAVEINLRQSGTTHPQMLAKLLTKGQYDEESGMIKSGSGSLKYYLACDNLISPYFKGLSPASIIAGVTKEKDIHFCPTRETGVMFHLLSPVREVGKIGVVCIGNTRQEAVAFYDSARELLDKLASQATKTAVADETTRTTSISL